MRGSSSSGLDDEWSTITDADFVEYVWSGAHIGNSTRWQDHAVAIGGSRPVELHSEDVMV